MRALFGQVDISRDDGDDLPVDRGREKGFRVILRAERRLAFFHFDDRPPRFGDARRKVAMNGAADA